MHTHVFFHDVDIYMIDDQFSCSSMLCRATCCWCAPLPAAEFSTKGHTANPGLGRYTTTTYQHHQLTHLLCKMQTHDRHSDVAVAVTEVHSWCSIIAGV